jgi:polysaccharide biosynthesis/export protein
MNTRRCIFWLPLLAAAAAWGADAPVTAPNPAQNAANAPAQPVPDTNYIIGPGDVIQVFVWRNPELSVNVPVRPDGKVSTPLVEDIVAVGQTPSGLARLIETRLSEYIKSPQVNIIVTTPASALSRITVIGQVKAPGSIPYRQGMTVLDVVLASGGLGEFAGGNRAKLVRKTADGKSQEIRLKLADLVNKGKVSNNIEVKPGDVLVVPESIF